MRIAVSGGSGFIGEPLIRLLAARGDDVAVLTRDPARVRAGRAVVWAPGSADRQWRDEVASADAVVNLAGENVGGGRWTEERKRRIVESRVTATRALTEALSTQPARKRVLVNASAVGYYGASGDKELNEQAPSGHGFLADVVRKWEELAREGEGSSRLVILRFGVVLAEGGGALGKMLVPFRLGVGGPIAGGDQWMSWIDRDDAVGMILWALDREEVRGVYNATSPQPVRNREFTRELGAALHRPALMPTPAFALKLVFGQMADEMLISGQRVVPARAASEGFKFQYPTLAASLKHVLH